jgi:site-specific DNA recombinase
LIYIRKSTDEQDNQKNSIAYQKTEGIKFAQREKLIVAPVSLIGFCVNGVISEKHSGFKEDNDFTVSKSGMVQYQIDRPKFQKLVHLLSLGRFKGIVCLCWDRMSRNKGDDTIIRKLMRKGTDIRFVYANYDKTSAGALHMDIDGMFSEHHSRVTAEKVRLTTSSLRERGVVTYRAPIGYLNEGNMEHKPFDPVRAPILKKLFEMYAAGDWSITDLVRFANDQGLTTVPLRRRRTATEMLAEENEQVNIEKISRPITVSFLQKILTNPFYTGKVLTSGNYYIPSISHEPLVSTELFGKVQTMLKSKKVSVHYTQKIELPLRGLIRCAGCGRVYTPYLQKGIQYFGARCSAACMNTKKSFKLKFFETEIGKLIGRLAFTEKEQSQLDGSLSTDIIRFENAKLQRREDNDRKKKRVHEDLLYLQSNKLQLLRGGAYTPELIREEENRLTTELQVLHGEEADSDVTLGEVIKNVLKLSELVKSGSLLYSFAKSQEKEQIAKNIFSELLVSENTLKYKCKNGYQVLDKRFFLLGDPTDRLSEAMHLHSSIKESIQDLTELFKVDIPRGP